MGRTFQSLTLADSSKVEVGDIVLAIGDPFGVGQTVTQGIVSATGRGGLGIEQLEDFIQTDAAINPGNSGGALVDDEGHLIGINTAILSGNSGGNQGIGFAVPINMARARHGRNSGAWQSGARISRHPSAGCDAGIGQGLQLERIRTERWLAKLPRTAPPRTASLKQGDIIVAVNGQPVADANQLRSKIGMMDPNATVTLKVMRDGKPQRCGGHAGRISLQGSERSLGRHRDDSNADTDKSLAGRER